MFEDNTSLITLNDKKARHMHLKNPGKPVLVFLPGSFQDIEGLQTINLGLAKDYDYHVVELPGTGLTDPLEASWDCRFLSDCLHQFVTSYLSHSFHLVSCSYATATALEYAAEYSGTLDSLVLAGSMKTIPKDEWGTALRLLSESLITPEKFSIGFLDWLMKDNSEIPRHSAIKKTIIRKASKYSDAQRWMFIYNSLRLMTYTPSALNNILCPTLCFTGSLDPYVTPMRCQALANEIPHSEFTTIPNTDHLFHIESPSDTVSMISGFIEKTINLPSLAA